MLRRSMIAFGPQPSGTSRRRGRCYEPARLPLQILWRLVVIDHCPFGQIYPQFECDWYAKRDSNLVGYSTLNLQSHSSGSSAAYHKSILAS